MRLEGVHHITAITGDAPRNVEFYTALLGLRMVKRTVNQDDPTVYHLFYGDEDGSPGMDLTFFEYPGAAPGRPGAGMIHRILWRVGSPAAVDFWEERLAGSDVASRRSEGGLIFADPEGLEHELVVSDAPDQPLRGDSPEVPTEHALLGFEGARAYASDPGASEGLLGQALGFRATGEGSWEVRGQERGGTWVYDAPPPGGAAQGAGSVHHIAFASQMGDHDAWRRRAIEGGAHPTPEIDRFYFRSIYFREPSGVLFEIATIGPGFAVDEDEAHLGERLSLPPRFEPLREQLEARLTPLPYPPAWRLAART